MFPSPVSFTTLRGAFPPTDIRLFRGMKHGVPQQPIRFGLITTAISFQPGDDVGIQTYSYGLLLWTIELAYFGLAPVENGWRIGKINVLVSFCGDGLDVSFLLLCELPHRLSFRVTQQRVPK